MALYQIIDSIKRETWKQTDINLAPELTKLFQSGLLTTDPRLTAMCNSADAGTILEIRNYFQENAYGEPTIGSDLPTDVIVPDKIGKSQIMALLGNYNKAWSASYLATKLDSGGLDAFEVMRSLIANYWNRDIENRVASMGIGILNSNIANNAGDLLLDSTGTNYSYNMLVDAEGLRGDHGIDGGEHEFLFMHSRAYGAIKKADNGRERPILDASGNHLYTLYDEKYIIMPTDIMPLTGNTATVMTAKAGAFLYGESQDVVEPLAYEKEQLQGNGSGIETIVSRKRYLLGSKDFSWTSATQASDNGASLAEFQDATNWERKTDVKQSPISFIKFDI